MRAPQSLRIFADKSKSTGKTEQSFDAGNL
jgi:hypothetical protein